MKTIEKTIYKFDELDKDIKNKLIEEEKTCYFDSYMEHLFYNDMEYRAGELLCEYFDKNCKLDGCYYDLSYSQGSGAMIMFTTNFENLNNKYHVLTSEEVRFLRDKGIINDVNVIHNNNFYYHEYTFDTDYSFYNYWTYEDIIDEYDIEEELFDTIEDRVHDLLCSTDKHYTKSPFIKDIISMNKELVKFGYDIIENYEEDTGFIIEHLRENEYYENGEIYE